MFLTLFYYQARGFKKIIRQKQYSRLLLALVFLLVLYGVALGIYKLFYHVFLYVISFEEIKHFLLPLILQTTFLFLFFLMMASFMLTFILGIFSKRLVKLMTAPIKPAVIFWQRFLSLWTCGSWPLLLLVLPIMLALALVEGRGAGFVVVSLFGWLLIALLTGLLAALVALNLAKYLKKTAGLWLPVIIGLLFILSFVFVKKVFLPIRLIEAAAMPDLQKEAEALARLPVALGLWPTNWLLEAMFEQNLIGLLKILIATIAIGVAVHLSAVRGFLTNWQSFSEGVFIAGPEDIVHRQAVKFAHPEILTNIILKDFLVLKRKEVMGRCRTYNKGA